MWNDRHRTDLACDGGAIVRSLPYFRWYPADAETDAVYMAMTDEQRGFFHHCLNVAWINGGLPADPKERARVLERNRKQADARWAGAVASQFVPPPIIDCYPPCYLVNTRQEQERIIAQQKSASASDSAKARYERSTTETRRRSSTRAYDCVSVSGVSLKRGSGGETETEPAWKTDAAYVRFTTDYLATGAPLIDRDFADAYELWQTLEFNQQLARQAGLVRHAEEYRANPRFVPSPLKFLRSEWERPVRPPARPPGRQTGPDSKTDAVKQLALINLERTGRIGG